MKVLAAMREIAGRVGAKFAPSRRTLIVAAFSLLGVVFTLALVDRLNTLGRTRADDRSVCQDGRDAAVTVAACTRLIEGKQAPRGADLAVLFNQRGLGHARLGAHERAVADLDEAIRLNPSYAIAFNNRSWVRANAGELDLAIADASEAIPHKSTRSQTTRPGSWWNP